MKYALMSALGLVACFGFSTSFAQDTVPRGATARCTDGTYYIGSSRREACDEHDGVDEWLENRPTTSSSTSSPPTPSVTQVWANSASGIYHCPSEKWYGKTRVGQYLSEAEAMAKGFRSGSGKHC